MYRLISTLALLLIAAPAVARTLTEEYEAGNDPISEGWFATPKPDSVAVGFLDDAGTPAWFVRVRDWQAGFGYTRQISATDISAAETGGFVLRAVVRAVGDLYLLPGSHSYHEPRGPQFFFDNDDRRYLLHVGTTSEGDLHLSPMMDWFTDRVTFVVAGSGSGYHDIQIVQRAGTAFADVFVDGRLVYSRWGGSDRSGGTIVGWGASGCEECQANFNLIQLWVGRGIPVSAEGGSFGALKALYGN
jgi:hypothetical protein